MANKPSLAMLLPAERIVQTIRVLRGQKVLLDMDLALLYGVETRRLNEQVRRNRERFPDDFMFQLTAGEFGNLKSQFATSSWGGRRKLPFAFTEHGAIMAATVLNSVRAIEMSIYVVRVFVQLRELLASNKGLAAKLDELEHRIGAHDRVIVDLVNAIRELMQAPEPESRPIGFVTPVE
jgi:ORF6N domain